jgi:hypothetical protein
VAGEGDGGKGGIHVLWLVIPATAGIVSQPHGCVSSV